MNLEKSRKVGVMASSLEQLMGLAREKFAFKENDKLILMLEEDETEVQDEDYFQSLDRNTPLVVVTKERLEQLRGSELLLSIHTEVKQELEEIRIDDIKCISGEVFNNNQEVNNLFYIMTSKPFTLVFLYDYLQPNIY